MARLRAPIVSAASAWLARLRFPVLFGIALALFLVDLVVPDGLPLVDEILLGLLVAILGRWRSRRTEGAAEGAGGPGPAPRP